MKRVVPIENPKSLKKGDILVYTGHGDNNLSYFTKSKEYPIQSFYDCRYGVVLINDRNNADQVCNDNVRNFFRLLIEETEMETEVNKEYQKLIDIVRDVRSSIVLSAENDAKLKTVEYGLKNLGSRPVLRSNVQQFMDITTNMAKTYAAKNHDYGNSFDQSLNKFGLIASIVRMNDKMNRFETLASKKAEVKNESVEDTLLDLANYSILTVMWLRNNRCDGKP